MIPMRNNWIDYFIYYCTRVVVFDPTYVPGLHYCACMRTLGSNIGLTAFRSLNSTNAINLGQPPFV